MKRVISALLAAMMVILAAAPVYAASADGTLPSGISKDDIGAEIEAFVSEHEETTAGMAVSVFDRNSVIYRNYFGYADMESGLEVDENTVMEWGSVTKLLVWVSAMQLWEQGKLDLDADIQQYLPEGFLRNLHHDTPVTMVNLMNHNAGFEDSYIGMSTADENRILSLEDYLTATQPRQIFVPGEVTAYSNWGVALAGYIVERISGMPFYAYVQENIFAPLGMEHSALNADLSDNPWVKQQREKLECYTTEAELMPECLSYIIMYPAGMCTSTLEDFETFARALLDRESVLFDDSATYDIFMAPTAYFGDTDIPMNHHGLWALGSYGVSVIGHGGNTAGCSAYLLLNLESGTGMTILTNQSGESIYNYEMPELVFGAYEGENLDFTGYVTSARSVFRGPLQLQQLLNIFCLTPEITDGMVSVLTEVNGIQKVTVSYGDYLVKTLPELIWQFLPVIFWALGLLFCLLNLIARGIGWVIRKLRRREANKPAGKWTIAACILQLLPLIPVVFAVSTLFSWEQWALWAYDIVFGSFLVWLAVYAGLAVYGIREMVKNKKASVYSIAVVATLIISIVNILCWELGAFWLL